jgi:hypothetical protein
MSSDALSTSAAALKELRAQRAAIDRAIAALEALVGGGEAVEAVPPAVKVKCPRELAQLDTGDASVWMLREKRAPMTNRQIADALAAMGYKRKSTEQVSAALNHRAKHSKKNDIKRSGQCWIYIDNTQPGTADGSLEQLNGAASHAAT